MAGTVNEMANKRLPVNGLLDGPAP